MTVSKWHSIQCNLFSNSICGSDETHDALLFCPDLEQFQIGRQIGKVAKSEKPPLSVSFRRGQLRVIKTSIRPISPERASSAFPTMAP